MKKRVTITSLLCLSSFLLGIFVTTHFGIFKYKNTRLQILQEIFETLENDWYYGDEETMDELFNKILSSIYDYNTDPYTYLIAAPVEPDNKEPAKVGIGVTVVRNYSLPQDNPNNPVLNELGLFVMEIQENSPSSKAGLKVGDNIVGVYDNSYYVSFEGLTYDKVRDYILGEIKEETTFKIKRDEEFLDLKIVRDTYEVKSVHLIDTFKEAYPNSEVIKIDEFKESTGNEMKDTLKMIENPQKKDLILDLRDNPGGYVFSMALVASYFLKPNLPVLVYEDKNGNKYNAEKTSLTETYEFNSLTVLINHNSASASEALTLCLKYYQKYLNKFLIVGEKSYGKGIAQTQYSLSNGATLQYTFAKVYDPSGELSIHQEGIVPDREIKLGEFVSGDGKSYYDAYNTQLEKAIIESRK